MEQHEMSMDDINYSAFQYILNPFTLQIKNGTKKLVKLRNGIVAQPQYFSRDDDGYEVTGFRQEYPMMYWNADGTSITRNDYDMISFVDI